MLAYKPRRAARGGPRVGAWAVAIVAASLVNYSGERGRQAARAKAAPTAAPKSSAMEFA